MLNLRSLRAIVLAGTLAAGASLLTGCLYVDDVDHYPRNRRVAYERHDHPGPWCDHHDHDWDHDDRWERDWKRDSHKSDRYDRYERRDRDGRGRSDGYDRH